MGTNYFEDESFQDYLVTLIARDPKVLGDVSHLLTADDFKPTRGANSKTARSRWIVAERALEFYQTYHNPIRRLLRSDCLEYADSIGLGDRQKRELEEYCQKSLRRKIAAPDSVVAKVLRYKGERIKTAAIEELVDLQAAGQLTDEKWYSIAQKGLVGTKQKYTLRDYFEGSAERIARRKLHKDSHGALVPMFLIRPLDDLLRGIGYGQLGLVMAPLKRGKSMFLLWLTIAFSLQKLSGIYITLEDPVDEVENRLDAAISGVPYHSLAEKPKLFRRRFNRFRRFIRSRLKVIDGTEEGMTVAQMEQVIIRERNNGFQADYLIVDYDDEITPPQKHKERRLEFADIYRELRRLASRQKLIVWTAAQTQRGTEKLKILTGDKLAEDISKARKATMTLSLGQGEWGDASIFIWLAYHKFDQGHVGCHVVPDKKRLVIYDPEKTNRAAKEYEEKDEAVDEEVGDEI